MGFIDFILNLAGLLLWFNWRMAALNPLASSASGTLAGTLKRKGSSRLSEWMSRLALVGLLFGRGAFYWLLGPAVAWPGPLRAEAPSRRLAHDPHSVFADLRPGTSVFPW